MTSEERHEARYIRRRAKRLSRRLSAQQKVGDLPTALPYSALYQSAKDVCKNVRWKTSTKNFDLRRFSRTARCRKRLVTKTWTSRSPCTFYIMDRGHKRKIDAPHIDDRQVHKTVCRQILRPLYYPHMVYDNGASIEGKGFSFSIDRVVSFLSWWYRRNGTDGFVVTIDFKGYFPNAPHDTIEDIHKKYILDPDLRDLTNYLLNVFGPVGMALGVETSQTEAGILPNAVDHRLKDEERLHCFERYMDDTLFVVHTREEAEAILGTVKAICAAHKLKLNDAKTHITPLTGWFKFCQWRFHMTETGQIIKKPSRRSITTMQRKLKAFRRMVDAGLRTVRRVHEDYKCWKSYIEQGNSHNVVLRMDRLFKKLFGFYP